MTYLPLGIKTIKALSNLADALAENETDRMMLLMHFPEVGRLLKHVYGGQDPTRKTPISNEIENEGVKSRKYDAVMGA